MKRYSCRIHTKFTVWNFTYSTKTVDLATFEKIILDSLRLLCYYFLRREITLFHDFPISDRVKPCTRRRAAKTERPREVASQRPLETANGRQVLKRE